MQALFAELVKAEGRLALPELLVKFNPNVWMTYEEVVGHHDRIRESATTYGQSTTVNIVRTEIRRYEHDGLVLECEEHGSMARQTVTDAGTNAFSKIEFIRCTGRGDFYLVYHEKLASEELCYTDSYTTVQIGGACLTFYRDWAKFSVNDGNNYEIIFRDGKITFWEE